MTGAGEARALLTVRQVKKSYQTPQGPLPVLRGVDLSLAAGRSLALMGESGSGKSTLLHLVAGLDAADSGEIRLGDHEITALDDAGRAGLRRAMLGIVFQQFNLVPSLSVGDNIAFQARLADRFDSAWFSEVCARLGLSGMLERYPEQLSGGQQQRVAVGRALLPKPALVLADEPTGNLDEATGDEVLDLMLDLVRRAGAGFLMVTHSARLAERLDGAIVPRAWKARYDMMTGEGTGRDHAAVVRWTLAAFLSHWRRHPGVLAQLIAGLAIATALWSGVQALNQQARQSYDRAAQLLATPGTQGFAAEKGRSLPLSLYVDLKRKGFAASPVLEGEVRIGGRALRVVGIEPLSLARIAGSSGVASLGGVAARRFMTPPGLAVVSPETAADLSGASLRTAAGALVPAVHPSDDVPPGVLLVDIAVAERLLDRTGEISRLIVPEDVGAQELISASNGVLRLVPANEESELQRLTGSFHLNLTAFGLLSFIVGLFIVYAAIGLAFEQRLGLVRTVRAVGVSALTVTGVLAVELIVLALAAGALGMVGGYVMAAALMPNVAASLSGLYGAAVPGTLALDPSWWALGLLMTLLGAGAAGGVSLYKSYHVPLLQLAHPAAWREAQARLLTRQAIVAVVAAGGAASAYMFGEGLVAGFLVIAGALLASALALPLLIAALLRAGEAAARHPLLKWALADSRQQLGGLSLALMALLLALSANIGVGTMVDGFRATFKDWLDRRLFADVYIEASTDADAAVLKARLAERPGVQAVLELARTETRYKSAPLEVIGASDHPSYRAAFEVAGDASAVWESVAAGTGVLISEQMQRRTGLDVGDEIEIPAERGGVWRARVADVYSDYGNPKAQVRGAHEAVLKAFPSARQTSLGLLAERSSVPSLIQSLETEEKDRVSRVVDQAGLKAISMSIFDRTFAVTTALNVLTLLVSGVALLSTLLTLAEARLVNVAPLWAMGVPRRRLAEIELARIAGLCGLTALAAIPLGVFLAWCLVAIVNVRAFGWRLPLHVFPEQWLEVMGLALATGLLASIVPIIRLRRTSAAALLKVFANER